MTLTPAKMREVFFDAASSAALFSYKKHGRIPCGVSVLIKNGKNYDLMPVIQDGSGPLDVADLDVRDLMSVVDGLLAPVVKYVNDNKGAEPEIFFLSVKASGGLKDIDTGETSIEDLIITAARTSKQIGRTMVYQIGGKADFIRINPAESKWRKEIDKKNIPVNLAQTLLDMIWKSYMINKNLSTIGLPN